MKVNRARPFWSLDCETDPFLHGRVPQPFIWGLYTGADYHEFATARDVADHCARHRAVVYAHNGGKFDYHYLREFINSDEPIMIINQRLARFKIGDCEFRDSMNLIPAPLSAFQKESFDYAILEASERDKPGNREKIRHYLKSDCVNLYDMLARYFENYGRGLTQAGAAMKAWEKIAGAPAPRQTVAEYVRYRPFYYGGRVECFASGNVVRNFSVFDMNSAYPHAMMSPHPYSTKGELLTTLPENQLPQCLIRLEAVSAGALPYRESNGTLSFPNDDIARDYSVTGWEVQAALEANALDIRRVVEVYRFAECRDFAPFVEHFYGLRKVAKANGDKASDLFAKIMLNGLYGKFGANPEHYHEYVIATGDSYGRWQSDGYDRIKNWTSDRFLMRRPLRVERHRYYNIATAASITGYVRARLFRAMRQCGEVLYCDTDSIAAGRADTLETGTELGQWKLEMECDEFAIAGKKLYGFHRRGASRDDAGAWKIASKGVRIDSANIIKAARGGTVEYRPQVPTYSALRETPIFINRNISNTLAPFRN